ncbi:hypothetical protein B0O80DRAFT_499051 [Mortierella sp. GBAus27b]|nr:hypothetical protein BGX31_000437 [Mortierella sp. GBA43]KAI8352961.1 hypothetical protein B0O80DRAFT_499051 [Mortierella sp. GBAus27b]
MKRLRTSIWIHTVLTLALVIVRVPPWLVFKGNTIGFVCAIDTSSLTRRTKLDTEVADGTQDLDDLHEPLEQSPQHTRDITDHTVDDIHTGVSYTSGIKGSSNVNADPAQPDMPNEVPVPRSRPLIRTYYVRLSALPGTEEARIQHTVVVAALTALPGRVTIRHEFGMDEDDVLNVISFKLEGDSEGLEDVAALSGVIGIYPVRTRKRPKALPLGALKFTSPSLYSAHAMTGVAMVHKKLGLTGKGIKVGIIDTGIDYTHPALGGCFGKGCTVAFGYDFVGDDYDHGSPDKDTPRPDSDPMDCSGHGTHVAGIVAARNVGPHALGAQEFLGVAPDVTLGAYRVFGCEGEVGDDVLLAALKASYRDGMDVVNLSLGGPSGWPEEPFAIACSAYIAKGLHIAVANGNDGEEGLFENGAPATAIGAVAVGSVDNSHFLGIAADLAWETADYHGKFSHGDGDGTAPTPGTGEKNVVGRIGMAMAVDDKDVPVVSFKSGLNYVLHVPTGNPLGCTTFNPSSLKDLEVPRSNIVVLVRRGGCAFTDKAGFVVEAKLGGMLVFDTVPEQRPLGMTITKWNVSAAGLSFEDATLILDALNDKAIVQDSQGNDRRLVAQFSSTEQVLKLASGGKVSDFSSWGPDARLRYKPDIVTPGGMIYSTFPLAKGGFSTLQGTSMASPYMAGILALYLSRHGKTNPLKILNIMQSTATPTIKSGSATGLTPVFQQGAGLVSMEAVFADDPPTIISPTALYLNDTQFQKLDHDVSFHNPSSKARFWTVTHRPALSVNGFENDRNHYSPVNQSRLRTSENGAQAVVTPIQLELTPGGSGVVHVHIDPPKDLDIRERWLYSGYLEFHCRTDNNASCGSSFISYGGMSGYLGGIPIMNPELTYPSLELDRNVNTDGATFHENDNHRPKASEARKDSAEGAKHDNRKGSRREQNDVIVGKNEDDWVQILVSINFPTSLLTIEVESVCDGDQSRGSGDDKIRLEIGGSGHSRFQIETDKDLEEAEHIVSQVGRQEESGSETSHGNNDLDPQTVLLMQERLSRSRELAFMPSGLYMPYEGYSSVMVEPSTFEEVVRLHRKNKSQKSSIRNKSKRGKTGHVGHLKNSRKQGRGHHGKGNKGCHTKHRHHHHRHHRNTDKSRPGQDHKPKSGSKHPCIPRILGLIPNGFNPWCTRTGSAPGSNFQSFAWMGDLLLQNHDAVGGEDNNDRADVSHNPGDQVDNPENKKNKNKKHTADGQEKNQKQTDLTKDLPDGRYRLVVKVLKPWGIRGKASDVERWSSPVVVIKRKN